MEPERMNLSFAGCGFLGIYHIGVASCFRQYAPQVVSGQISGASAGALVACTLINGCDLGECTTFTLKMAREARSRFLGPLHPNFEALRYLKEGLDSILPPNAHITSTGRLNISLTRVRDKKNIIVNEFHSKEELIECLICSAFVPFFAGFFPPRFRGEMYVDGGLTNNIIVLNEHTLSVSPFAGESDICPNDHSPNFLNVNLAGTSMQLTSENLYRLSHALLPPHPEILSCMCRQGFDDALKFLQQNNLINCTRHLSIHSSLSPQVASLVQNMAVISDESDNESIDDTDLPQTSSLDKRKRKDSCHLDCIDGEPCSDCRHIQHTALLDNLPTPVISALQAACDSVNLGFLTPLYNSRAYQVLSLLSTPLVLPVDVGVHLIKRFYKWGPYMPKDMQWFVFELYKLIRSLLIYIQDGRHKYSARFTCQLAVTEQQQRELDHMNKDTKTNDLQQVHSSRRQLNLGFSVDFLSNFVSPIKRADEIRSHLFSNHGSEVFSQIHAVSHCHNRSSRSSRSTSAVNSRRSSSVSMEAPTSTVESVSPCKDMPSVSPTPSCSSLEKALENDSIKECLTQTDKINSVLSFYYAEEDDPNTYKVSELFALGDPSKAPGELSDNEMEWDYSTHTSGSANIS